MPRATDSSSGSRHTVLRNLIGHYRGEESAIEFERFRALDPSLIANVGKELLEHTPIFHGACAPMSAAWTALLRDRHNIPAVAVAGDLIIEGASVFLCDRNVPDSTDSTEITPWDGHCWIEVDGQIGDVSIFRTARTMNRASKLKTFVEREFGLQRGLMLVREEALSGIEMVYSPKYVLTEPQINGLLAGLKFQVERAFSNG